MDYTNCKLKNGRPGICTNYNECAEAKRNIHRERPNICYFEDKTPFVCCPKTGKFSLIHSIQSFKFIFFQNVLITLYFFFNIKKMIYLNFYYSCALVYNANNVYIYTVY